MYKIFNKVVLALGGCEFDPQDPPLEGINDYLIIFSFPRSGN